MKNKLILIISCLVLILTFTPSAKAMEESTSSASPSGKLNKYNLTFPITELGNCASVEECKTYCELPVNKQVCLSFAKQKGFYKAENKFKNAIVKSAARTQLGCDSQESCKAICSQEKNKQKCREFAQKYNLTPKSQINTEVLKRANQILGCSSEEACKKFCFIETNRQKCYEVAKAVGLITGIQNKESSTAGKPFLLKPTYDASDSTKTASYSSGVKGVAKIPSFIEFIREFFFGY